jgi:hypothetical protein
VNQHVQVRQAQNIKQGPRKLGTGVGLVWAERAQWRERRLKRR